MPKRNAKLWKRKVDTRMRVTDPWKRKAEVHLDVCTYHAFHPLGRKGPTIGYVYSVKFMLAICVPLFMFFFMYFLVIPVSTLRLFWTVFCFRRFSPTTAHVVILLHYCLGQSEALYVSPGPTWNAHWVSCQLSQNCLCAAPHKPMEGQTKDNTFLSSLAPTLGDQFWDTYLSAYFMGPFFPLKKAQTRGRFPVREHIFSRQGQVLGFHCCVSGKTEVSAENDYSRLDRCVTGVSPLRRRSSTVPGTIN